MLQPLLQLRVLRRLRPQWSTLTMRCDGRPTRNRRRTGLAFPRGPVRSCSTRGAAAGDAAGMRVARRSV